MSTWTVGFKKTFTELLPRFPGLFLFPIFGLFTFGPKSHQNCQCPSYGNNKMQVSFLHTYVNLSLWVIGFFGVLLFTDSSAFTDFHQLWPYILWPSILAPVFGIFLLLLLFQLLEKTCCISCCSPCCLPFTERSVFVEDSDEKDTEQQQNEGDLEMIQVA